LRFLWADQCEEKWRDEREKEKKETGKAARRSRLLREMRMAHGAAKEVLGGDQAEKDRQAHGLRNEMTVMR
jgi:hypothetical protein